MRYLVAGLLVLLAAAAIFIAWWPLSNLWADYQDSSTSTYLLVGLPFVMVGLAALVAAASVLRRR
jgi:hypothetical protein